MKWSEKTGPKVTALERELWLAGRHTSVFGEDLKPTFWALFALPVEILCNIFRHLKLEEMAPGKLFGPRLSSHSNEQRLQRVLQRVKQGPKRGKEAKSRK